MSSSRPLADGPGRWPLLRQLRSDDRLGRGAAVKSRQSAQLRARSATADRVVKSVCPYCAVGCAQNVYVKDERVIQIEGDPDAPHSRGRLCPKGSATLQLTTGSAREGSVLYRPPYGSQWESLSLDAAMDMVAERVIATRREGWEWEHDGSRTRRCMSIAGLGGATLDNEENYLIKKLLTALGIIQIENQARVCHSSTVVGLGTSFGRGASSTLPGDLQNADLIVLEGSNMAEAHPVAFQWVLEAKARGATVIHVDPHYSRTSALADIFVPLRAGTDIAFLGAIINHVLQTDSDFREYVLAYTNAPTIIGEEFEDAGEDGIFSGYDSETLTYKPDSWQYEGAFVAAAAGQRDQEGNVGRVRGGEDGRGTPRLDPTLSHPRCVWQILKRHYAPYTPEMVERVCGVPQELFATVCRLFVENSGRERTTAFVHGVGWTQHTIGSQYIRAASILQLLLGNIGRPGGGVMAMRGHASIQGSSDIPTLFDTLPGYIPMPHAHAHGDLTAFVTSDAPQRGFWGNIGSYVVSLLKAWWGPAASAENDWCFDYLPRLTGSHSTYDTVMEQIKGTVKGYFLFGQNPAVGSANNRMQRLGMSKLDWLVVRDFSLIESATWWKDGPEIESGEMRTEDIATEVFFFPAAAHTEKEGTFTNTQRMVQWHHKAVEPADDQRSDLWFTYHLGRRIRERLAGSQDEMDRPLLDLTWDYPTEGPHSEPSAAAVLAEINGWDASGTMLSAYTELRDDGSTSCGCWIYCGCYANGVNQTARRKPAREQNWTGADWAWAWPANRRILYNRASADPQGRPWSERKALVWWDAETSRWVGHDTPDFEVDKPPDYRPPKDAKGPAAIAGDDPFIMQADGRGWLYAPAGVADGPLPTHYEPQDSPVRNRLHRRQRNPARQIYEHPDNRYHPDPETPGSEVFPYIVTTYRLTEHFTAGGMSRWTPYLAELQPEFFCEVSPELAMERGLEHADWATLISARGAVEARVLVTDRMTPLHLDDRVLHQIGLPYHWGPNGYARGDSMNELSSISLDPSSHIQEVKALTVDIRPGRRPRGAARQELVREYCRRAGITARTGMKLMSDGNGYLLDVLLGSGEPADAAGYDEHPPRMGFFTDTSLCIGCKACEVACKEWNQVPEDGLNWSGHSHDNSGGLGADTWRHVAFVEQPVPVGGHEANFQREGEGFRWLMASDVCKHCTHAACLDVCPTGAIFRTEFGTVVVQQDICNGCGYCVPACPYGVLDKREDDGRIFKCTLCYDRLLVGQEPACAKACPTDSIQFGELDELRERAGTRVEQLHESGALEARLYGHDPHDGVGGDGAFFLLLDEPEVYGLPPDPVVTTRDLGAMWKRVGVAATALVLGSALSFAGRRR